MKYLRLFYVTLYFFLGVDMHVEVRNGRKISIENELI